MRFSRQPNGRWCGYSTISDSFYHVHLTDKEQMERVKASIDWLEANDDLYHPEGG